MTDSTSSSIACMHACMLRRTYLASVVAMNIHDTWKGSRHLVCCATDYSQKLHQTYIK